MFPQIRAARQLIVPFVAGGLLCLTGCPGDPPAVKTPASANGKTKSGGEHEHHHHHHAEKGPHGGALVAIGHDDAHLEIVLDEKTGTITAYVLDGAAEKPIAIKQKNLQLALTLEHHHDHDGDKKDDADKKDEVPDETVPLMLAAVSPAEDGTASEFSGQLDALKGADEFEAALTMIKIGEKEFPGVTFKYPQGNEHDHHH